MPAAERSAVGGPEGSRATHGALSGAAALTADRAASGRPKLLMEVLSSVASAVVVALADTGASTTLVSRGVAERIRLVIRDSEIELTGLNGRASTIGESTLGLRVSDVDRKLQTRNIVVEALPEGQEMLLSCNGLKAFGLIHQEFPKPCVSAGDTLNIRPFLCFLFKVPAGTVN